jgi:hypothetical protein
VQRFHDQKDLGIMNLSSMQTTTPKNCLSCGALDCAKRAGPRSDEMHLKQNDSRRNEVKKKWSKRHGLMLHPSQKPGSSTKFVSRPLHYRGSESELNIQFVKACPSYLLTTPPLGSGFSLQVLPKHYQRMRAFRFNPFTHIV